MGEHLDRKTGQLISANAFTPVTWASGVDQKTGRPIGHPDIRYDKTGKSVQILPGAPGAHSWQAMAFNPKTGLVHIPAREVGMERILGRRISSRRQSAGTLGSRPQMRLASRAM